jgi:hypothetical protein
MNDFSNAEKMLLKTIELEKDNPDTYFETADFYFRNRLEDKFGKCVEFYEKTLELDSKYHKWDIIIKNLDVITGKIHRADKVTSEKAIAEEKKLENEGIRSPAKK